VYAPCTGGVVQIEDQLPDKKPLQTDPRHPAGNFVRLECGEAEVVMAHLMQSSLTVDAGQKVRTGQLIGRVGNSGLSTEPHLHLHAQHRGPVHNFLAGEPMPIWVDGRILVRNSRLAVGD
jgi:murein DD-endopeptidase MepM/ murein hydrolase activator NlpD